MMCKLWFWLLVSIFLHFAIAASFYFYQKDYFHIQSTDAAINTITVYVNQEGAHTQTEPVKKADASADSIEQTPESINANTAGVANGLKPLQPIVPVYPEVSRTFGEAGTVELSFFVEANGETSHIEIVQSSGYKRLDAAAELALTGARFVTDQSQQYPLQNNKLRFVFSLK